MRHSLALEVLPYPGLHSGSRIQRLAEGDDGRLWFAFPDRLQVLDGARVVDVALQPSPEGRVPGGIRAIAVARGGRAFLATDAGLWSVAEGAEIGTCLQQVAAGGLFEVAVDASGAVFARTPEGYAHVAAGGSIAPLRAPSGERVEGIARSGGAVLAYSDRELWQLSTEDGEVRYRHRAPLRHGRRLVIANDGDASFLLDGGELLHLPPEGPPLRLAQRSEFASVRFAAATRERLFLATSDELLTCHRDGSELLRARLLTRSVDVETRPVLLEVDTQGILWIGTQNDVVRVLEPVGIDHFVFDDFDPAEVVTAVAETPDGTILVGTSAHRLLERREGEFRVRETPWPVREESPRRGIESLHVSDEHALVVGSVAYGLWSCRDGKWARIEAELQHAMLREVTAGPDGALWALGDRKLLVRANGSCGFRQVPMPARESEPGASPASLLFVGQDALLATFQDGLLRRRRGEVEFSPFGEPWAANGPMQLLPSGDDASFHAISPRGLYRVDRGTGARTLLHGTRPAAAFRSAATAADGRLWLATQSQLTCYDPERERLHVASSRDGAHPLGYSWRAARSTKGGDVWFGSRRGLTLVRSEAFDHLVRRPRLAGVVVESEGQGGVVGAIGEHWQLPAGTSSIHVRPRVVDRVPDVAPSCRVWLRHEDGREFAQSDSGVLSRLEPGTFAMFARVDGDALDDAAIALGLVTIESAPFRISWIQASILALGLATLGSAWIVRRRPAKSLPRRIAVDRLLAGADRSAEQTLDVAFLAVAAGEECARASGASHATVFLAAELGNARARLAEFGSELDDAEARAEAAIDRGRRVRDFGFVHTDGGADDLLLCTRGVGSLALQILLHRVPVVDERLLDVCQQALAPVKAGLRKQAWLERLEADFARQSARLAAGMHDLRGSLTSLRVGAFSLGEGGSVDEVAANGKRLSVAAEHVLLQVERLLDGLERASGVQLRAADPIRLVHQCVSLLEPRAAAKGIRLRVELPERVDGVQLDPAWFARTLENVIGNALKFSPAGSDVSIRGAEGPDEFALHVDDHGPGFRDWEREAVFLPGVTGSAQPTAGERQSGLGLWVARQAIRAMGGRLWIEPNVEHGARIVLVLPRAVDAADRA